MIEFFRTSAMPHGRQVSTLNCLHCSASFLPTTDHAIVSVFLCPRSL